MQCLLDSGRTSETILNRQDKAMCRYFNLIEANYRISILMSRPSTQT